MLSFFITEKYLEAHGSAGSKMTDAVGGSNESISAVTDNAEPNVSSEGSINGSLNEPATHSLSGKLCSCKILLKLWTLL